MSVAEPLSPPRTGPHHAPVPSPPEKLPGANRRIEMPEFRLGDRLTSEQRDFLDTAGFIRFRGFLSKQELADIVAEVEDIDAKLIRDGVTHKFGIPLLIGPRGDGRPYVQRMCFASLFGEKLHALLQDPRWKPILDVAGPDYRIGERERDGLVINHYRNERGSTFKRQGWHTDSLRDVFYFEKPRRYLNVGVYLDDSPVSKGGVRLLPFSHEQTTWNLLTRKKYYLDTEADPGEYAIEAEAGDLTIHDGRIWHRVAQATVFGEDSQRRVMYVPLMNGPKVEKTEASKTPFYFNLRKLAKF